MQKCLTGENLSILISCDYLRHHHWMSFLTFYSLKMNLPDAKVYVASPRRVMHDKLFDWTRRCNVPLFFHKDMTEIEQIDGFLKKFTPENLLVLHPNQICVRSFEQSGYEYKLDGMTRGVDDELTSDCKSEKITSFVSYDHGWGTFNMDSWINKRGCPLIPQLKFTTNQMTPNEMRISKIWQSASNIFAIL